MGRGGLSLGVSTICTLPPKLKEAEDEGLRKNVRRQVHTAKLFYFKLNEDLGRNDTKGGS